MKALGFAPAAKKTAAPPQGPGGAATKEDGKEVKVEKKEKSLEETLEELVQRSYCFASHVFG